VAEDSDLEKTEQASPQRLEKAREEGDVPRSRELAVFVSLLSAGGGVWLSGTSLMHALQNTIRGGMQFEPAEMHDASLLIAHLAHLLSGVLLAFAPVAGVVVLVAVLAPAFIGGWVFTTSALIPNFNRINPMNGIGHIFSLQTLIELIKAVAKALLVGIVAWAVLRHDSTEVFGMLVEPLHVGLNHAAQLMWQAYLAMTLSLGVVALIDVPYQLWQYADKHKMTRQELRQEAREAEGDPQIRARIRAQQREMARRRMMSEVPKADVVVTNPTHYSVALRYAETSGRAPMVVAKGMGEVAARIREIATENGVPLMEAPPLARALYAHVELEQEIPEALYAAVAEVLAYVFQLRSWKQGDGRYPDRPEGIVVPAGMDPHEEDSIVEGALE